jgi:hypothetical protein
MDYQNLKNASRLMLAVQKQTGIIPYTVSVSSGLTIVLQGYYNSEVAKFLNIHADRWSFEFIGGLAQFTRFVGVYKIEIVLT